MTKEFTLTRKQKEQYVDLYESEDWRNDLMEVIDEKWTIVYDDTISIYEFPCTLYINNNEYDQLAKDYTEELLGGVLNYDR